MAPVSRSATMPIAIAATPRTTMTGPIRWTYQRGRDGESDQASRAVPRSISLATSGAPRSNPATNGKMLARPTDARSILVTHSPTLAIPRQRASMLPKLSCPHDMKSVWVSQATIAAETATDRPVAMAMARISKRLIR